MSAWLTSRFEYTDIWVWMFRKADAAENLTLNGQFWVGKSILVCCMSEQWVTLWSRPALICGNSSTMGGMHFHPASISIQIIPHEVWNLFLSCFWWEKLEVMPTRETSWDNRHLLSWGQRSSCGKVGQDQRIFKKPHHCHAYFRTRGEARMDWRVPKAYSHIFHWYQSHMAGFH